jgi:probable HAF family extracellular repeat protein
MTPAAVNDNGDVVGTMVTTGGTAIPFLYTGGTVYDLTTASALLIGASPTGINNTGQIVFNASNSVYLATPMVSHKTAPTNVGVFRDGFFWLLDVDGNEMFDSPPDLAFPFGGIAGDIPITGDWNGNGHTKVGVYRSANGLFILDSNGDGIFDAGDAVYNLGLGLDPTDIPVVGDWNGDGRSKVGIFRQGFLWLLDYDGNGTYDGNLDRAYEFGGIAGDKPVVGDWTGTGTSKIGIFRLGFFWILDANGNRTFDGTGAGQDYAFPFGGISGDSPVVGDWKGTGISKVGVFREGFFWVLDANNPGDATHSVGSAFAFGGILGDKPVTGKW